MIHWEAQEFKYHRKSTNWFTSVIGVATVIVIIALWQKNLLFAVFAVIAAVLVVIWGKERPRRLQLKLDDKGLWVNKKFYDLRQFDAFALGEEELKLRYRQHFRPFLTVNFPEEKSGAIRKQLLEFLPEIEYTESLTEALSDWLRF